MAIEHNKSRIGCFTSSEIGNLMKKGRAAGSFGEPALKYILQKKIERKMQRSIGISNDSRPLLWGKCIESVAFEQLGIEYTLNSQDTIAHPTIDCWVGSPDGTKEETVFDIKCPYTPLQFGMFGLLCEQFPKNEKGWYDCNNPKALIEQMEYGDKYYWQLVSNAILTGATFAELIYYMPFEYELEKIRNHAVQMEFQKSKNEFAWIHWAAPNELPWLPQGCGYGNLYILRFVVPEEDKKALTERVLEAQRMLLAPTIGS